MSALGMRLVVTDCGQPNMIGGAGASGGFGGLQGTDHVRGLGWNSGIGRRGARSGLDAGWQVVR